MYWRNSAGLCWLSLGQLTLRKLRLKKGALDKFRLPVDVIEGKTWTSEKESSAEALSGHLGTFTLSLHWLNLGNQPVEILIEDVYMLVIPSPQTNVDPEEEERRAQAAKAERLENAELLHLRGQAETQGRMLLAWRVLSLLDDLEESTQTQGLLESLTAKIINNVQVTVKNIHIRYEDNMSVPDVRLQVHIWPGSN